MAELVQAHTEAFLILAGFLFMGLLSGIGWLVKRMFDQFEQTLSGLGEKLEIGMERLGGDLRAIHQAVATDIVHLDRRLSSLEGQHQALHGGTRD